MTTVNAGSQQSLATLKQDAQTNSDFSATLASLPPSANTQNLQSEGMVSNNTGEAAVELLRKDTTGGSKFFYKDATGEPVPLSSTSAVDARTEISNLFTTGAIKNPVKQAVTEAEVKFAQRDESGINEVTISIPVFKKPSATTDGSSEYYVTDANSVQFALEAETLLQAELEAANLVTNEQDGKSFAIPSDRVSVRQAYRTFAGGGANYDLPVARATADDGRSFYAALKRAGADLAEAGDYTLGDPRFQDSNELIPQNATEAFKEGFRELQGQDRAGFFTVTLPNKIAEIGSLALPVARSIQRSRNEVNRQANRSSQTTSKPSDFKGKTIELLPRTDANGNTVYLPSDVPSRLSNLAARTPRGQIAPSRRPVAQGAITPPDAGRLLPGAKTPLMLPPVSSSGVGRSSGGVPLTITQENSRNDGRLTNRALVEQFDNVNPKSGAVDVRNVVSGDFSGMSDGLQSNVISFLKERNARVYGSKSDAALKAILDQPGRRVFVVTDPQGDVGGIAVLSKTNAVMSDGSIGDVNYLGQVVGGGSLKGAGTQATVKAVQASLADGIPVVAYTTGPENMLDKGLYGPKGALPAHWATVDPDAVQGGPYYLKNNQTGELILNRKTGQPIEIAVPSPTGNPKTDIKQFFGYQPEGNTNPPVFFWNPTKPGVSQPGTTLGNPPPPSSSPSGNLPAVPDDPLQFPTLNTTQSQGRGAASIDNPPGFNELSRTDLPRTLKGINDSLDLERRLVEGVGSAKYKQTAAQVTSRVNENITTPLLNTSVGQRLTTTMGALSDTYASKSQAFATTPAGQKLTALYDKTLGNEKVWDGLASANSKLQQTTKVGAAATMGALMMAGSNGTLKSGYVTAGDASNPVEANEVARALNMPKGTPFQYYYAKVPDLPAGRAMIAIGMKTKPTVLLPATEPGQAGRAQPWIGPSTQTRKVTATSTSVVAGPLLVGGWSFGTPNANITQSANAGPARAGLNAPRIDIGPGAKGFDASILGSFDFVSAGYSTRLNLGPVSLLTERLRDPVSGKVNVGTGGVSLDPTAQGRQSNIVPVFSLNTGYDPTADDVSALKGLMDSVLDQMER